MSTNTRIFVIAGVLVAVGLALFVSPLASDAPDGLEKVAAEEGFDESAADHDLADSPLADYEVEGIDDEETGTAAAGLIGVLLTFGIGLGVFGLVRVGRERDEAGV